MTGLYPSPVRALEKMSATETLTSPGLGSSANRVESRAQSVVYVTHQLIDADAPLAADVVDLPGGALCLAGQQVGLSLDRLPRRSEYNPIGI